MTGGCSLLVVALLALVAACHGSIYDTLPSSTFCKTRGPSRVYAASSNIAIGHYSPTKAPVSHVLSGQTIELEVLTHAATHFYSGMIKGDAGVESVFKWLPGQKPWEKETPKLNGTSAHVVTGPIWVCGAEPGDVLKVQILKMVPRPNPAMGGRTFGVNSISTIGYHATTAGTRYNQTLGAAMQTVYEVKSDASGSWGYPVFSFRSPRVLQPDGTVGNAGGVGATVPHPLDFGPTGNPETYPLGFNHSLVPNTTINYATGAQLAYKIPLRPHLGIMGVLPANGLNWNNNLSVTAPGASTSPPSKFGGNIDDWRIGRGTTMYYQCEVEGCKLFAADTHAAQGDSELSGTAIETSFTATLKITLLKAATLPLQIKDLSFPLGETAREYFIHGFAYNDYLSEILVPSTISQVAVGGKMNSAFLNCYSKTRNFLMDAFTLTEEEAIGVMSTSVDFIVTQVVDGNWGIHGIIKKVVFAQRTQGRKLLEYLQDANILEQMELRAKLAARKKRRLSLLR